MTNEALYAVILAGGASARFWPFDGDANPKFMLSADRIQSLLAQAWERCVAITDPERILVVTGVNQAKIVARELPELSAKNILIEPARRDTMAAAAWAMAEIQRRDRDAVALLTPADSHYSPPEEFPNRVIAALESADLVGGCLYALGVKPTRPETGFGYIEAEVPNGVCGALAERFVEKPDLATAESYLASGRFYWNVGSFLWRVEDFLNEVERQHPAAFSALRAFMDLHSRDAGFQAGYEAIHKTSIDYGVMEGAVAIGCIPLASHFDDIGTWDALAERGALSAADLFEFESSNCIAHSKGSVGFVGVQDLIVVVEGDRVLVAKRGAGQKVKEISKAFAARHSSAE